MVTRHPQRGLEQGGAPAAGRVLGGRRQRWQRLHGQRHHDRGPSQEKG